MKLHLLPSITLLPPPHDTADEVRVIEDWARGLDWVRWLLGSVRARTEVLTVEAAAWEDFVEGLLPEVIGPALKSAWQAAQAGDLAGLLAVDEQLSARLHPRLAQRSFTAGAVLLKSTRHARYQAVLGRLREAVAQGRCRGHIVVVWAAVGHFFQLSLANVIAEYLHLEWDIAVAREKALKPGAARHAIARVTRLVMQATTVGQSLRVVDA